MSGKSPQASKEHTEFAKNYAISRLLEGLGNRETDVTKSDVRVVKMTTGYDQHLDQPTVDITVEAREAGCRRMVILEDGHVATEEWVPYLS